MRLPVAVPLVVFALVASVSAQSTRSTSRAYALVGSLFTQNSQDSGYVAAPTTATSEALEFRSSGGQAFASTEFTSGFGTLRARLTADLDNQGNHTRGLAYGPDDFAGEGHMFGGEFSDVVTIGGGGTFRFYYSLSGSVGHTGPGAPVWRAKLYAGAFGTGVTLLRAPGFFLRFEGTGPSSFYAEDYYEFLATPGAELNIAGVMGALMDVIREAGDPGVSHSVLDATNTGKFRLVPMSPGMSFSAASGTAYTSVRVSGNATLEGLATSAFGMPVTIQVREVGSLTPLETHHVVLGEGGTFSFETARTGSHDVTIQGPSWLRAKTTLNLLGDIEGLAFSLFNGDVNGDNSVNLADFLVLRGAFGSTLGNPGYVSGADLNRDGTVNVLDFLILRSNFGRSGAA